MKYYLAPLEGITGYIYRRAYHEYFENFDKYFLPFIAPHMNRSFNSKELNDLIPEHNEGMYAVPQVLTNHAEDFLQIAGELGQLGYTEINLNLGCPSGTVAAKGRGSGFLSRPEELDRFLDEVMKRINMKVSIKTRVGRSSYEEWSKLLDIYNQYPLEELIVHPRIQKDFYRNKPNMETFAWAAAHSTNPLCYNGDLFCVSGYERFCDTYPAVTMTMYGRGVIANPWLLGEIKARQQAVIAYPLRDKVHLRAFHDRLYHDYQEAFSGDRNVLFKMKEIWSYMIQLFTDPEKYSKRIRKAERACDYEAAAAALFQDRELKDISSE